MSTLCCATVAVLRWGTPFCTLVDWCTFWNSHHQAGRYEFKSRNYWRFPLAIKRKNIYFSNTFLFSGSRELRSSSADSCGWDSAGTKEMVESGGDDEMRNLPHFCGSNSANTLVLWKCLVKIPFYSVSPSVRKKLTFATSSMVSIQLNDVWGTSAKIPYWRWLVTT